MRIVHLSYSRVIGYNDPITWLKKIAHTCGVLQAMAQFDEVWAIYHIGNETSVNQKGVTYYFTKYSRLQLLVPLRFNLFIKRLRPDAIIVHGLISPFQILLLRLAVGRNVSIIAHHHAEKPLRDVRQYLQQWADLYIKAYIFSSVELAKYWVSSGQIRSLSKINEVMGMSSVFYPISPSVAKERTLVTGHRIFLWVGGLDQNKDPMTVARGFASFHKMNKNCRLYMIYQTYDLLDMLTQFINNSIGAREGIILVGKVDHDDLQYWYNSADYIISSSHYEGAGISVCEGLSCGCIPILTDIPSFKMMTANGQFGLLFKPGNEKDLTEALNNSLKFNLMDEKKRIVDYFNNELSFEAAARKMKQMIVKVKSQGVVTT